MLLYFLREWNDIRQSLKAKENNADESKTNLKFLLLLGEKKQAMINLFFFFQEILTLLTTTELYKHKFH